MGYLIKLTSEVDQQETRGLAPGPMDLAMKMYQIREPQKNCADLYNKYCFSNMFLP
jgi:hypothetical protein